MSLLRPSVPPPAVAPSPLHEKISALDNEIRALRPSRPMSEPPGAIPEIPADRSARALLLLAELARHQISLGQLDEARRTVGEAVLALDEATDARTIARASTMIGEAMLGLDAPQHAKPRLQRAIPIFDRLNGDGRWGVRARIALGRALVALDDITGLHILTEAREACVALGEKTAVGHIDAELREAEKTFDTPRHVHTGYGRPVSFAPPAR